MESLTIKKHRKRFLNTPLVIAAVIFVVGALSLVAYFELRNRAISIKSKKQPSSLYTAADDNHHEPVVVEPIIIREIVKEYEEPAIIEQTAVTEIPTFNLKPIDEILKEDLEDEEKEVEAADEIVAGTNTGENVGISTATATDQDHSLNISTGTDQDHFLNISTGTDQDRSLGISTVADQDLPVELITNIASNTKSNSVASTVKNSLAPAAVKSRSKPSRVKVQAALPVSPDNMTVMQLLKSGYHSQLKSRLFVKGLAIDEIDPTNGYTVLHYLARSYSYMVLDYFLGRNPYKEIGGINAKDHRGETALHHAIRHPNGNLRVLMVTTLLRYNPDTSILNADGISALEMGQATYGANEVFDGSFQFTQDRCDVYYFTGAFNVYGVNFWPGPPDPYYCYGMEPKEEEVVVEVEEKG